MNPHARVIALISVACVALCAATACGTEECEPVPLLARDKGPVYYAQVIEGEKLGAPPLSYLGRRLGAMTFNVLYESGLESVFNFTRSRDIDSWGERRVAFGRIVRNYAPSLLSLQESTSWQASCMQAMLPDYRFHYESGLTDSILAWRSDEFDEIDIGVDRLPLPKGKVMTIPRSASWAVLRDKVTQKKLLAVATHFDNRYSGFQARHLNEAMASRVANTGAAILFGDTNIDSKSDSFRDDFLFPLWKDSLEASAFVKQNQEVKRNTFLLAEKRIDHIVYAGDVHPLYWEVTTVPGSDRPVSDHWPVTAVFELRAAARPTSGSAK